MRPIHSATPALAFALLSASCASHNALVPRARQNIEPLAISASNERASAGHDSMPGEYVYVEEPPEVLARVAPIYPRDAREAGIDGTVQVMALVGTLGIVRDVRVTGSVPMLDQAAMDAVRQWRFKPARSRGKPVEVWITVPIKFSMH